MTTISITLPDHGDADWDVDLDAAFGIIVDAVNDLYAGSGGGGGPITSASITDATTVGKAVLTAADAAAGRTALGAASASALATTDATASAAIPASQKGANNGVATLNSSGVIPDAQIPSIAITDYLGTSANQTAMLALTGQKGDWTIRTDLGTVWTITGSPTTSLGSWTQMNYPTAPVTSVAGRTGAVTLTESDISGLTADLTARVLTTRTVNGKALSADVTLAVADISGAAPSASPTLTGTVTVPTKTAGDNTTAAASTAFVAGAVAASAPTFILAPADPDPTTGAAPGFYIHRTT